MSHFAVSNPRLRKLYSRPALEGGKRHKGQLIFKSLEDGNSVLEYRSEGGTIGITLLS